VGSDRVVTLLAALFFTRVERKTLEQCLGESYFHTSPLNIVSDVVLMLSAEFSQKRGLPFFLSLCEVRAFVR